MWHYSPHQEVAIEHPASVIEKAQQMEHLLIQVEQGIGLEEACAQLNMRVNTRQLSLLQARYEAGKRRWEALLDGRFGHAQKVSLDIQEWLYERKRQQADLPTAQQHTATRLGQEIRVRFQVELKPWQINYALRKRGLTRPVGRPSCALQAETDTTSGDQPLTSDVVDNVGLFFLEAARQEMGVSETIEKVVQAARQTALESPSSSKPRLLTSGWSTLWSKLAHLLYLPLLGLERPSDLYYLSFAQNNDDLLLRQEGGKTRA